MRSTGAADALVNPKPVLTFTETDVVVTRRRVSAFTGSDLEIILRAKNIDHLVLTGILTSGVVLSTFREAVDKDYILTVLSDLCADRDEEVHRVLTEKVFPRENCHVISSTVWLIVHDAAHNHSRRRQPDRSGLAGSGLDTRRNCRRWPCLGASHHSIAPGTG